MADAARVLEERSRRVLPFAPAWQPLASSGRERPAVAAVDGSHAVLADNGAVWVVATRAAAVHWPGTHSEIPVAVTAAGPDEAQEHVDALCTERGVEAPVVRGAEAFAEALRTVAEHDAAGAAAAALPRDGLLLLDGALERLPRTATELAERVVERARQHGVAVAGVAKRSRLDADGVPLVPALRRAGLSACPDQAWAVAVPGYAMAHVALLHPQSQHAFRVDVTAPDVLADLLPLCRDAVYTGYPYPLAAAHNAVAIGGDLARRLRGHLGDAVRQRGPEAWRLLADFHDVLDRNAPRS